MSPFPSGRLLGDRNLNSFPSLSDTTSYTMVLSVFLVWSPYFYFLLTLHSGVTRGGAWQTRLGARDQLPNRPCQESALPTILSINPKPEDLSRANVTSWPTWEIHHGAPFLQPYGRQNFLHQHSAAWPRGSSQCSPRTQL